MFESVTEEEIFPTTIWVHDLEPGKAERMNRQLFHDLDRLTAPRPNLQPGQNWQTDQILHELEEFSELVEVLTGASQNVLDRMEVDHEGFEITACWANISPRGAAHPPHFHPNNFLSGVYYVQVAPGADSITFHEPRPQVDIVAPHVKRYSKYTAPHYKVQVRPGRLVMFPAWLTHSVQRNENDNLRISISFNIMFSSFTKTMSRPRWEGIPVRPKSPQNAT